MLGFLLTTIFRRRHNNLLFQTASTSLGKSPDESNQETARRWQKQSLVLKNWLEPQTFQGRDFPRVIEEISSAAVKALEVEQVNILLYREGSSQLACVNSCWQCQENPFHRQLEEENPGEVVENLGHLSVPIWHNEQIVGFLTAQHNPATASPWQPQDKLFAQTIANLVTLILAERERQLAQRVSQESEEWFRAIFEQSGLAIAQIGVNGQLLRVNQQLSEITGYSQAELLQKTLVELAYPEEQADFLADLQQIFNGQQQTIKLEKRYLHKTGSLVWLKTKVSLICTADGKPKYGIGLIEDITERKEAEAQLQKAIRDRVDIFESMAEAFYALDKEWRFTYINQKAEQFLGRSRQQLLGQFIWDEFPETLGSQFEEQYHRALTEQVSVKFEEFYRPLNVWFKVRVYPYEAGLSVFFSDISEWKEAEAALLKQTRLARLATVVEDQLGGLKTLLGNQGFRPQSNHTFRWVANAIAVAVDRYWARSELLSRRESLLFGLANQIRNSLELDTILETTVDSVRSLLKVDRCQFFWRGVQDQRSCWQVIKESRNPDLPSQIGECTADQAGPLAKWLLEKHIIQVDEVEKFSELEVRQTLLKLGCTSILLIPVETQAGEIGLLCCSHCTLVRAWDDSEVELLRAVGAQLAIALDQAALYDKERQSALIAQAQAQELELTLNQLKTAQAKLVQSARMSSLGQLVAGIAHEINNPVSFIHGNITYARAYIHDLMSLLQLYQKHYPQPHGEIAEQAELIDIEFIAEDIPQLVTSMQRGTDRIRSIVSNLRNFSRLDEARMKRVDLHEGIESTLSILQHRLKPKSSQPEIKVVKEYGELPKVECYPGQLNQVFLNILNNAIEAFERSDFVTKEKQQPTITIRTCLLNSSDAEQHSLSALMSQETGKDHKSANSLQQLEQTVVIQVVDNGPGMTESVLSRLFDPFFTTKPVGKGIGFGLSISYQIIVEHHHGILTCSSELGQGSEFWLEIPLEPSGFDTGLNFS
ncbi:MAG: PAS domain S-box protein [Coleofasciculaceae cyanobacterium]